MSNYQGTKAKVNDYLNAEIPLIIIDSKERERVERLLREINDDNPRFKSNGIYYYTDSSQVTRFGSDNQPSKPDGGIMRYIFNLFEKKKKTVFVIGDGRNLGGYNIYTKDILDTLYKANDRECTLILVTSEPVWSGITRFGMISKLEYPDQQERIQIIQSFKSSPKADLISTRKKFNLPWSKREAVGSVRWDEGAINRAATLLRGFSEIQIHNILSTLLVRNGILTVDHLVELTEQKSHLYSAVETVEPIAVRTDLSSAGLEGLKDWLKDNKQIFFLDDDKLAERDLKPPKGVLLAGIPGCGKSLSAKIVASEWELPLFRFDIGSIYDKWMGNSEKRMRDALDFIENMAPCILWIDEIEKGLSVSETNNDTGQRILGQLLFWLQESQSKVFLIATANSIENLPPELYRKGRFSEIFFVDLPNSLERRTLIEMLAKKSLLVDPASLDIELLVERSKGFSYSDIEECMKDLAKMALLKGQQVVDTASLDRMFSDTISISQTNAELIAKIREWGKSRAVSASERRNNG